MSEEKDVDMSVVKRSKKLLDKKTESIVKDAVKKTPDVAIEKEPEEIPEVKEKPIDTSVRDEMNKKNEDDRKRKEAQEMFDIIEWYKLNCGDIHPQDLGLLLEKRAKLAAYSVTYAKVILRYGKEYANYHVTRSINVKIRANELQAKPDPDAANNKTYTNARSLEIATIENQGVYRDEYMAEANYNGHKLILNQVNAVLSAMQQDIAELRNVREDSDKTKGDNRR